MKPRPIPAAVGALALLALLSAPASASPSASSPKVLSIQDIAGRSPFIGHHCNVATPYYTSPGGKEGEPYIAVNPKDPANRIAVWMDATRATDDTAFTKNAGRTWTISIPPGIDECTGNFDQPWEASGDPWISFGPDGVAYLSTLTWAHFVTPPFTDYVSVVHVQTSTDGGRTWSNPVLIGGAEAVSDKPMVVADPYHAGTAYEIWRNQSFGLPVGHRGTTLLLFSKTTDWGQTWGQAVRIAKGSRNDFFGSPQLSVLRNGTLVGTSSLVDAAGGTNLLAWHSTDRGASWSGPLLIRNAPGGDNPPVCGQSAAGVNTASSSGQQTVSNGSTVLLVSQDGPAATQGNGEIILSSSRDGGRTWQNRAILRSHDPLLLASITAGNRGQLGLIWDEVNMSRANCVSRTVPARTRFAVSSDWGRTWSAPISIGNPAWNLADGLRGSGGFSGYFVGDYQALASTPSGFSTITVQGRPLGASRHAPAVTGKNGVMVSTILVRGA
jgi:hypothetical protein